MRNSNHGANLESMSQAVWYNQWTLKLFDQYLSGKILEVGCGIGNFTPTLTKYGQVTAIDIREDYIRQFKDSVSKSSKVGFGDIEKGKYFFKIFNFDTIVCMNVLEHIERDEQAVKNMYLLLKRGGCLILLVPAHQFLYGKMDEFIGHHRRYEMETIIHILEKVGFRIIRVRKLNFLGALGWWFFSKVLGNNKVEKSSISLFNFLAPIFLPWENLIDPPIGTSILAIAKK